MFNVTKFWLQGVKEIPSIEGQNRIFDELNKKRINNILYL